ncbi:MAG: hypothetical protein JKX95_00125 [Bacteroidia bacterium]|nr:hypothetical protein [Bacteroidia bacterium]
MQYIVLLICCIGLNFLISCNNSVDGNYVENNSKKADSLSKALVKKVTGILYQYVSDSLDKSRSYKKIFTDFNKEGKEIQSSTVFNYDSDSSYFKYVNKYNEKGDLVEKTWYNVPRTLPNINISFKEIYSYSNDKLIEAITYNSDGSVRIKKEFVYEQNNLDKERWYNIDGSVRSQQAYIYNDRGNIKEKLYLNSEETIEARLLLDYNEKNMQIKTVLMDNNDNIEYIEEFIYDDSGNKIKLIKYSATGKPIHAIEFSYEYFEDFN